MRYPHRSALQQLRRLYATLSTKEAGSQTFVSQHSFGQDDINTFVSLTSDHNEIHVNPEIARKSGFRRTIVPGILSASLFPAIISSHYPGALYLTQTLKFREHILVDEVIEALVTPTKRPGGSSKHVSFTTLLRIADSPNNDIERIGRVVVEGTALARTNGNAL
jgi:acyl dehydratase